MTPRCPQMEDLTDLTTFWGQLCPHTYIYELRWESWWRKWDTCWKACGEYNHLQKWLRGYTDIAVESGSNLFTPLPPPMCDLTLNLLSILMSVCHVLLLLFIFFNALLRFKVHYKAFLVQLSTLIFLKECVKMRIRLFDFYFQSSQRHTEHTHTLYFSPDHKLC